MAQPPKMNSRPKGTARNGEARRQVAEVLGQLIASSYLIEMLKHMNQKYEG